MAESSSRDLWVGVFVLAGLVAAAYLSVTLGGAGEGGPGGMQLVARFDQVGGLKPRARVVVGGVRVGRVARITLDDDLRAEVLLEVDEHLELSTDTSASILTSGVLGDQYVELEPGGEEELLADGSEVVWTQGAMVLERLIGKALQSFGVEDEE